MKKILFSLLCITIFQKASAQTTIWSENFDRMDISDWILIDADGDGLNWDPVWFDDGADPDYPSPVLRSSSWLFWPLSPDNYAISPVINIKEAKEGKLVLKWKVAATDSERDILEQYTVYISTSPELEDIKKSTTFYNENNLDNVNILTERELDISEFLGQDNIYVTFRHHHNSGYDVWMLAIDDISIEHTTKLETSEQTLQSIKVTPNPIANEFSINLKNNQKISKVDIYDLSGKILKSFNNQQTNYSIATLPKGIYIIKIIIDNIEYSQKIIKK